MCKQNTNTNKKNKRGLLMDIYSLFGSPTVYKCSEVVFAVVRQLPDLAKQFVFRLLHTEGKVLYNKIMEVLVTVI